MKIKIEPVHTIDECRIIEKLQQQIWACEEVEVIPDHFLITLAKENGMVLLARNDVGEPVGFALGFPTHTDSGQLKLASHMVGVTSQYQSKGVGYQIKLAQREIALAQNIDLITWTFDPLLAKNARLNLGKLGAVCNTYFRNLYGGMRNILNQGLPTDRFRVDWWIASRHVAQKLQGLPITEMDALPVINHVHDPNTDSPLSMDDIIFPTNVETIKIELPSNIIGLKSQNPSLAQAWQAHVRDIFETAFAKNYTAIDLFQQQGRIYYILQRNWQAVS